MTQSATDCAYLISELGNDLPRFQLPSVRQVSSRYESKRRLNPNQTIQEIVTAVIDEVNIRWSEIMETIYEWDLQDRIKAMCFDTTTVNTGELIEFFMWFFQCFAHDYNVLINNNINLFSSFFPKALKRAYALY